MIDCYKMKFSLKKSDARLTLAFVFILLGAVRTEAATASIHYTYDQLGRVTTAAYDNGICIAYTYDTNGNRTAQTFTTSGPPASPVWGSGVWGCFPWTSSSK
jgi:YD repeat-containing protein